MSRTRNNGGWVNSAGTLIRKHDTFSVAYDNWTLVARELGIQKHKIDVWRSEIKRGDLLPEEIYDSILELWRSSASHDANKTNLVTVLKNNGLRAIADDIDENLPEIFHKFEIEDNRNDCSQNRNRYREDFGESLKQYLRCCVPTISEVQPDIERQQEGLLAPSKRPFSPRNFWILGALLFLALVLVGIGVGCWIWAYWNKEVTPIPAENLSTLSLDLPPPRELNVGLLTNYTDTNLTKKVIKVSSFKEYSREISSTTDNDDIRLIINMPNYVNWPREFSMLNTHRITELILQGSFTVDILLEILKSLPLLQYITLDNSDSLLCSRNKGQLSILREIEKNHVFLPELRSLSLLNFSDCLELYEAIEKSVRMEDLRVLNISNSFIGALNIYHVIEVVSRSYKLEILNLGRISESELPELQNFTTSKNVKEVAVQVADSGRVSLGSRFCYAYRNLTSLSIKGSSIFYKDLPDLKKCRQLSKIDLTVSVDESIFEEKRFWDSIVAIQNARLTLKFSKCPESTQFERLWSSFQNLNRLTICSNCKIDNVAVCKMMN